MELHHLHVLQRDADPQRQGHPVARARVRIRRPAVQPARAARGEDDGLRADRLQPAVQEVPGDHSLAAVVVHDELPGEELLVDGEVTLHHLLVEDVDQDVAGDVGGVGGSRLAGGAERALRDSPVLGSREDGAPVLELVDVVGRLVAEDLDRVLVAEVVRALDRVVGVLLGVVVGRVPERGVDPAFGGSGVAADRVDLREKRDVGAEIVSLDRGTHARAPGADDEHVVRCFHRIGRYRTNAVRRSCEIGAFRRITSSAPTKERAARGEDAVPAAEGSQGDREPEPRRGQGARGEDAEREADAPREPERADRRRVPLEALDVHRHRRARRPEPVDARARKASSGPRRRTPTSRSRT